MSLDIATGNYTLDYLIPKTRTTPAYGSLNAFGYNPVDGIVYGKLGKSGECFLIRVDATKVVFVAKIRCTSAATIDAHGDYLFLGDGGTGEARHSPVCRALSVTQPLISCCLAGVPASKRAEPHGVHLDV